MTTASHMQPKDNGLEMG